jgi:hypothetical protein
MEFHKVTHYFRVNKLSLHLNKQNSCYFPATELCKTLVLTFFVNNKSPNMDVESPNLVHKMEQINYFSKIPAMRFLGFFLSPT